MTTFQRFKKLKTATSLETACTCDDISDKEIKVLILPPKTSEKVEKFASSGELPSESGSHASAPSPGKSLMSIPVLSRRHAALGASNGSQPLQSQRLKKSNRLVDPTAETFTESLDFRSMNITREESSLAVDGQLHFDYIDNVISSQPQQNRLQTQAGKWRQEQAKRETRPKEEDCKNILKESSKIQQFYNEKTIQRNAAPSANQQSSGRKQPLDFRPIAHRLRLSSKYDHLPELSGSAWSGDPRGNSRLKLKDYIYGMETSRKHSRNEACSPQTSRPSHPLELSKARSEQKFSSYFKDPQVPTPKPQPAVTSKKQQAQEKYGISNGRMMQILREEILEEIRQAESHLTMICSETSAIEPVDQPSDEELLVLYNLRRRLKEDINKRLADALQSLKGEEDPFSAEQRQ